jgi:CheY-like chemotaxis protein
VAVLTKPVKQSRLFDLLMQVFHVAGELPPLSSRRPSLTVSLDERPPLRILLAEDNPVNQQVALAMLSRLGYRADLAANGLEAIDAVNRQRYDVVLMDVQMPEMDGLTATRRICAAHPPEQRPRIIALTANAMVGDQAICLEAGMDDYLPKPIRLDALLKVLRRAARPGRVESVPTSREAEGKGAPIEPASLERLRELDLIEAVAESYAREGAVGVAEMARALAAGDVAAVTAGAHRLKGSSLTVGASAVAAACLTLEKAACGGQLEGGEARLAKIEKELERAARALREAARAVGS